MNVSQLIRTHRLSEPMLAALYTGEGGADIQGRRSTLAALVRRGLVTTTAAEHGDAYRLTPEGEQLVADLRGINPQEADVSGEQPEAEQARAGESPVKKAHMPATASETDESGDESSDIWTIMDRSGQEIARVEGATADDMIRAAEALPVVRASIRREGGFLRRRLRRSELSPAIDGQHVVQGVAIGHAGTAEGSTPRHSNHPDVATARRGPSPLRPAAITDRHDLLDPEGDERNVRGYVVDPPGNGRVALHWLEGGRPVRRDDPRHGPYLDVLARKIQSAGWTTEKMLRSSICVFAWRPTEV